MTNDYTRKLLDSTTDKIYIMLQNMKIFLELGHTAEYKGFRSNEGFMWLSLEIPARLVLRHPEDAAWRVVQNLVHEMGHWLVASPSRRKRKNYGIYKDTSIWAQKEEWKARMAEKCLIYRLGIEGQMDFEIPSLRGSPALAQAVQWWDKKGRKNIESLIGALLLIRYPSLQGVTNDKGGTVSS